MKIDLTFDTVEKTMTCTVDGAALANVVGCSMYRGYSKADEYMIEVVTATEDETNDVRYYNRICASETPAGKSAVAAGAVPSNIQGFVIKAEKAPLPNAGLVAEMEKFFGVAK